MKFSRIITLIAFTLSFLNLGAQNSNQIKKIIYNIGTYKIETNEIKSNEVPKDVIEKILKNQEKIQFELIIDNESSLFRIIDRLEEKDNMDYKISAIINGGTIIYYKNINSKEKIYQAELQGQKFNIQLPFEQYKWEISQEYKYINGFKCYKATTSFEKADKGRGTLKSYSPIVWFTPEIPLPYGPKGLDGLPGLVLEATIDGFDYIYSSKIIFDDNSNNKIENPAKGKTITEDEFQNINAKIYNEIRGK